MQSSLARWGRYVAHHPRQVLLTWLVVLVGAGALTVVFLGRLTGTEFSVPNSGSARAEQLLQTAFRAAPRERDLVVLHSGTLTASDPAFEDTVRKVLARLETRSLVVAVTSPYEQPAQLISKDGHTALAPVSLSGSAPARQAAVTSYAKALEGVGDPRVTVDLTGTSPINAALVAKENNDLRLAEGVGVPIAAGVLLFAFGTVAAAALPLLVGVAGVLLAFGILGAASFATSWNVFVESTLAMVGIALGIDYSLFVVTRFREERARGRALPDAVGTTMATAGAAVLFSGTTVLVSLSGLLLVDTSFYRQMGYGIILAPAVMLMASLSLLLALLALLGDRIEKGALPRRRRSVQRTDPEQRLFGKLATLVMRRPVVSLVVAGAAMLALASPVRDLSLGFSLDVGALAGTSAGRGYELAASAFSAGVVSPIQLVVHDPNGPIDEAFLQGLAKEAGAEPGVAGVLGAPQVSDNGRTALLTLAPKAAGDSAASVEVVRSLRETVIPALTAGSSTEVYVGGLSARIRDLETVTTSSMPLVLGVVLAASFLLLLLAFRSLLLPLKAIAMNLLSVAAAYGTVVLVFQQGHLAGFLGFTPTGFLQVYLPLLTFAVLFGLSMDYEVFLVSRIREEWLRTGDTTRAVVLGMSRTAGVITSAATIMIAVFAAFLLADVTDLKELGFALAVAVLLDASIVRLILVPSLIRLFGPANWWLPAGLARRLPRLPAESGGDEGHEPTRDVAS